MCILSKPETPAGPPPVSSLGAASELELGTASSMNRGAGVLGRLGLMVRRASKRPASQARPEGSTTGTTPAPDASSVLGFYQTKPQEEPE